MAPASRVHMCPPSRDPAGDDVTGAMSLKASPPMQVAALEARLALTGHHSPLLVTHLVTLLLLHLTSSTTSGTKLTTNMFKFLFFTLVLVSCFATHISAQGLMSMLGGGGGMGGGMMMQMLLPMLMRMMGGGGGDGMAAMLPIIMIMSMMGGGGGGGGGGGMGGMGGGMPPMPGMGGGGGGLGLMG